MGGRCDRTRRAVALAIAAVGCGGAADPGPMAGRQLLAGRDFANLSFWNGRTLEFTRDAAAQPSTGPHDLWEWPLDEAAPAVALTGIDWNRLDPWPSLRVRPLLATGRRLERLYDVATGQADDLFAHFSELPPAAGSPAGGAPGLDVYLHTAMGPDGGAIARVRWDGNDEIVVGRPGDLRVLAIPGGGSIGNIAFIGADLAVLLRQTTPEGDVVGIHRLDTSSGALTPLVAPTPADEWVGVTGWCEGALAPCPVFGALGCALDESPCPGGGPDPCLVYYAKRNPVAPSLNAAFVHDVSAAQTVLIAGAPARIFANPVPRALVWGDTTSAFTMSLDACSGGVYGPCPFFIGSSVVWRRDGGAFVTYGRGAPTNIMGIADESCTAPPAYAAAYTDQAMFAPDGAHLLWVADDVGGTTQTLWLGDGNGQSPIAVAHGTWLRGRFSRDSRILYVSRYDSTTALGWVDVAAPSMGEHILSSNAGPIGVRGDRWVLFVDHYNEQDGNGDLVLFDLHTGAEQLLARAVTDVAVAGGSDAAGTEVAYAVRGRASAARDGLWLTTLPP